MWTRQRQKNSLTRDIVYLFTVIFIAYFAYHSYCGAFGLRTYSAQEKYRCKLEQELDILVQKRLILEKHAQLLRDSSVEKDTLDEYERKVLNLANKDDYVILTNYGDLDR